ncbi:Scr1 family TA system antitoxin-like transcriptional regulator [Amycolatopsis sp. Hca4]|uniref:Scr1 family TA system antitoxin-like transcriptional regulator n=1 Tax=Amycolatopsis sp. Hca4 TaxID=2742131 RepID=UPI00159074CB|nr:Scr1 family TA system antitoxin-like transcriptional regulator [Amycolatopsis sp. Hca4]QKV80693.1 helix-turn-helix transcriptional regulator [Amycolatopsis sp. Hca4]
MTKATLNLPTLLALSASLREARTAENLGLRALAYKLGVPAQNLSLWETGKRVPAAEDVARILGFLRVSPAEYHRVMRLRRQLDAPVSVETLDAASASRRRVLEELAVRTFEWAPHVVPEPLQTPEYIRAIAQDHAARPDDLDQAVFEHQVRQLDQHRTGHSTVLLGAAALNPAADPQLHALRAVASLPRLVIKIVPPGVTRTIDPFTIYEGQGSAFTVALRHHDNVIFISESDAVQRYRSTFRALERESVTCADFRFP